MAGSDGDLIRNRRREIAAEIERLQREDLHLQIAEEVLARLLRQAESAGARPRLKPNSQRQFVIDALTYDQRAWLKASDILQHALDTWGETIPDPSLRPLLTKLKISGVIVRNGHWIALRQRAGEAMPALGRRRDQRGRSNKV